MKKTLLIGTIVVLVLALAGGVIAFAAWDKPEDNIDLNVNNVANNVIVTATATPNSADTTKKLIPSVATITGKNDVKIIKAGAFNVKLSSSNTNASLSDLINKVDATYKVDGVNYGANAASANTDLKYNAKTWSDYVEVTVCKTDSSTDKVTNNALTIKNDAAGTNFYVFIAFKDLKGITDTAEQNFIKSLSGQVFKISMTINIASKPANA